MNKKTLIIIISVFSFLVVLITGYLVYSYFANRPQIDKTTKRGQVATTKKIAFEYNGNKLQVNDFLNYPVSTLDNGVLYIVDNLDYGITYWPSEKAFIISVMTTPVKDTSIQAEQNFLKVLGISEQDACKLNVMISGHYSVDNQFLDNKEYKPSFCLGTHLK